MTDEELRTLLDEAGENHWRYWEDWEELGDDDVVVIKDDYQTTPPENMINLLRKSRDIAAELLEARATIREMALQTLSDAGQMADLQDEVERLREENAHLLHVMNED